MCDDLVFGSGGLWERMKRPFEWWRFSMDDRFSGVCNWPFAADVLFRPCSPEGMRREQVKKLAVVPSQHHGSTTGCDATAGVGTDRTKEPFHLAPCWYFPSAFRLLVRQPVALALERRGSTVGRHARRDLGVLRGPGTPPDQSCHLAGGESNNN